MSLYLDSKTAQTKTAAARVTLPEDPAGWSQEILQEVYKQVPYISDYDINVVMDRVDAERGYGFGHVEVKSKMGIQPKPGAEGKVGMKSARIPIVVKEKELYPLDVVITEGAKTLPLTEHRLREALFRPNTFDVTANNPGSASMIEQLYPPHRQNFGMGQGQVVDAKMAAENKLLSNVQKALGLSDEDIHGAGEKKVNQLGKTAAPGIPNTSLPTNGGPSVRELTQGKLSTKVGSILAAISGSVNQSDIEAFNAEVAKPGVKEAYLRNADNTLPAIYKITNFEVSSAEKTASVILERTRPHVVQVARNDHGYTVKAASRLLWEPVVQEVDRGHVVRYFGEKIALDVDMAGSVTMADGTGSPSVEGVEQGQPEPVAEAGTYKVVDTSGRELTGLVFPNLLDFDGSELPISLFTNGSQSAYQTDIVGVRTGDLTSPPVSDVPQGYGCFIRVVSGVPQVTVPIEVKGTTQDPNGNQSVMAEQLDGSPLQITQVQGEQAISQDPASGTTVMPADFKWLGLQRSGEVSLLSSEAAVEEAGVKEGSARFFLSAIGPDCFALRGGPAEKLAQQDFLSIDDTLFSLAGLGWAPEQAAEKMAQAVLESAPLQLRAFAEIKTASDARAAGREAAEVKLASFPSLRRNLVKEAAEINDPMTVDTVLSLGFVNPENINTFMTFLPQLELSQTRLCELLLASRLGAQDLDSSSLEKTVKTLEDVIQSLKVIAFQRN